MYLWRIKQEQMSIWILGTTSWPFRSGGGRFATSWWASSRKCKQWQQFARALLLKKYEEIEIDIKDRLRCQGKTGLHERVQYQLYQEQDQHRAYFYHYWLRSGSCLYHSYFELYVIISIDLSFYFFIFLHSHPRK